MSETISLKDFSNEDKILLLKELGFDSDGEYVIDKNKNRILDKYLDISIKVENMMILPGSTIILDDNEYSMMRYLQEYEDLE